jgi:hypothetical protein
MCCGGRRLNRTELGGDCGWYWMPCDVLGSNGNSCRITLVPA